LYWLAMFLAALAPAAAQDVHKQDVISRDELRQAPLKLKALHRTPITRSPEGYGLVAFLAKGQPVTVLEMGETMDHVSAQAPTGPVEGWVDAAAVEAAPPAWLDMMRQQHEQAAVEQDLIDRHEIAPGMTRADVRASLGRPDRTSTVRLPGTGERQEQWVYITYRYLPVYRSSFDENGRLRQVVSYQRMPVGETVVVFRSGQVVTSAQEGGANTTPPGAGVPAQPPNATN
jgi:hypothetical protein